MFLRNLLIIFLVVPVILIVGSLLLPVVGRFVLLFLVFPLALLGFALWSHRRTSSSDRHREGGAA